MASLFADYPVNLISDPSGGVGGTSPSQTPITRGILFPGEEGAARPLFQIIPGINFDLNAP